MRTFLSSDGEAIILEQAMDSEVQALLALNNIDMAKNAPSATGSHQSADRMSVFKGSKLGVKQSIANNTNVSNPVLEGNLKAVFCGLATKFPGVSVSAGYKEKLIFGSLHIVHALQNAAMTPEKIRRGYTICGQELAADEISASLQQFPDLKDSSVNFDVIMAECYTEISPDDKEIMVQNIPAMVAEFRRCGSVTDAFMDTLSIPKLPEDQHINRDGNVLSKQHAQLLTAPDTCRKFTDYLRIRGESRDPAVIESRRQLHKAQKEIAKAEALAAKELKRQAAQDAKERDRIYLAGLSRPGLKIELARRRDQKIAEKEAKAAEQAAILFNSRARVAAESATLEADPHHANFAAALDIAMGLSPNQEPAAVPAVEEV